MGGEIVLKTARENGGEVIPVDSEHSAIFQVLNGREGESIDAIVLTASGGPFRKYSPEQLKSITVQDALRHPVWKMGSKITVDSASLANKGLEVIEAHYLFGIEYDRIEVVIHPQSIVHSMVRYVDGSMIAQMGVPDMKVPIRYALTYPDRFPGSEASCDLVTMGPLTFEAVRDDLFPVLGLAYEAGRKGGTAPAAFNAANEAAVRAFLEEHLPFHRIPESIDRVVSDHPFDAAPDWEVLVDVDRWARTRMEDLVC
jgi:1-deoxy-D-xylulose-5-phosphate reductoisomerase